MLKFSLKKFLKIEKDFVEVFPLWWWVALVFIVAFDLLSKKWMTDHLNFYLSYNQLENVKDTPLNALLDGIPYISILGEDGKWIKFRLVFNDRFIFGIGPSMPKVGIFITFFAIVFLFFYRWKQFDFGNPWIWLFIFSGAVGNFIDKLFVKSVENREWFFSFSPKKGYVSGVVDFVEFIWFGWETFANIPILSFLAWETWPTFNLADSLIVVGILLLFIHTSFEEYFKKKTK
ncbi:MAG: signal peptidase II [Leptonema sp. (in: bacteria)]